MSVGWERCKSEARSKLTCLHPISGPSRLINWGPYDAHCGVYRLQGGATGNSSHFEDLFYPANSSIRPIPARMSTRIGVTHPKNAMRGSRRRVNDRKFRGRARRSNRCLNANSEGIIESQKFRARGEHVFAGIEHMGGTCLRTIVQARSNFAMTMMAACYKM